MTRAAKSLTTLRRQVNDLAPGRSKVSDGGLASSAHHQQNPGSDHEADAAGVYHALDFTHDPPTFDAHAFADRLLAARDPRVKYLISNDRFGGPSTGWQWEPYAEHGPKVGRNKHEHHAHVSVKPGALGDQAQPWVIGPQTAHLAGEQEESYDMTTWVWNTKAKTVHEVKAKVYRRVDAQVLNWAPGGLVRRVRSDAWQDDPELRSA